MALLVGLTAAAITGAAGSTAATTPAIVTNFRWMDITNRTSKPIAVTVEVEEATISSAERRRFKVKQATPIKIKVKWASDAKPPVNQSKNLTTLELVYLDENHWDYTVAEWENGGLHIFPSRHHGWPNEEKKEGKVVTMEDMANKTPAPVASYSRKCIAPLNTETAGTALADESDQGTTEAEKNDFVNLPEKAQSDGTDSVEPIYHALAGGLTGLDFPQKIEAAQGPSGGQTMTQEPTSTIDQPLLDDKSSKNQVGKKVHWDLLTDSPQELNLQDNEVVISCGIRFSPSGVKLSETIKVTLDHNAHFNYPRRAEIVFYTRNKDSTSFERIPASTDGCPRCDVRSRDLDFYVDHFSDWWIVALIKRYFIGKRVECTPYIRPPVTKGFTHLVLLCIYDDLLNVIEKTNKNMKEYRMLYPPQQMFVERRCGDINIALFDGSMETGRKIGKKILGKREMNLVKSKQFSFEVEPLESGASQRFLEFTLDQTESTFNPTPIHFGLKYDGMKTAATTHVETISGELTDEEITRLSKLLPDGKYSELFGSFGFDYNYRQKILHTNKSSTAAFEELLHEWKDKGGSMKDLDSALIKADLGGFVTEYKN